MKPRSAKARIRTEEYLRPLNKYRQTENAGEYIAQRCYWDLTQRNPGCWIWTGPIDKNGYGQVQSARCAIELKVTRAHQLAYRYYIGEIPEGKLVCHTCDTPSCVNPDHLFITDWKGNMVDKTQKGRCRNGATGKLEA